ncbi:MAG: hypothetical protein ACYTF9_13345 [Planctomycetota bacterium]|jgi:hypothetical protein
MQDPASDKTLLAALCGAFLAMISLPVLLAGCEDGRSADTMSTGGGRASLDDDGLDFGDDWEAPTQSDSVASSASPDVAAWGIVLKTFSDLGHETSARTMVQDLAQVDGRLGRKAWINSTDKGSMVVYGRYAAADSPAATRDLEWIKGLELSNRQVFPRAMLSFVRPQRTTGWADYELMSVRDLFPHIDILYTLEIEVWGEFGGHLTWAQVQRKAEARARELRAAGEQAYVYHDGSKNMSMVTVGLFDHKVVDAASGIDHPNVAFLKRRFPHRLVNGEQLLEPIDPRRLSRGTQPSGSRLVSVPEQ